MERVLPTQCFICVGYSRPRIQPFRARLKWVGSRLGEGSSRGFKDWRVFAQPSVAKTEIEKPRFPPGPLKTLSAQSKGNTGVGADHD
jgi:hypothetical protein